MSLQWDARTMSTGVRSVDAQHQQLILQLNQLFEAMKSGQGPARITSLLQFCGEYAARHFADEESCMQRLQCPAAARNKQAHAQFLRVFAGLRERLQTEGASVKLTIEVQQQLSDWLRNHIVRTDTELRPCAERHAQSA